MKITSDLLDKLTAQACSSPRLRQNYDLRNSTNDKSQRMLNALEPGTKVPIHRHRTSSETVVVIRGAVKQNYYNDSGNIIDSYVSEAEGPEAMFVVPINTWHNTESLVSGTIIFEAKDGKYEQINSEDIHPININK